MGRYSHVTKPRSPTVSIISSDSETTTERSPKVTAQKGTFYAGLRKVRAVKKYKRNLLKKSKKSRKPLCDLIRETSPAQDELMKEKIKKFLVHSMAPVKIVNDPYFLDILGDSKPDVKQINSQAMAELLKVDYARMKKSLSTELSNAVEVFYTANTWTDLNSRRALVVTAHWVDEELNRKSAVLAIKSISYESSMKDLKVALDETRRNYRQEKIEYTATQKQNCSSMLSMLSAYAVPPMSDSDDSSTNYSTESTDFTQYDNVEDILLCNDDLRKLNANFFRCPTQTLNLCMLVDLGTTMIGIGSMLEYHQTTIEKCEFLWRHPNYQKIVKKISGVTPLIPIRHDWLSIYNALEDIVALKPDIKHICTALRIYNRLYNFAYLEEHLACHKPFACAIELLRKPKYNFVAALIPILVSLRAQLVELAAKKWSFGHDQLLLNNLRNLEVVFEEYYKLNSRHALNAGLAALSHPEFKNQWMFGIDTTKRDLLLSLFKDEVCKEIRQLSTKTVEKSEKMFDEKEFFKFGVKKNEDETSKHAAKQIQLFFECGDEDLKCLNNFPAIKNLFRKYNAPLSSFFLVDQMVNSEIIKKFMAPKNSVDPDLERKSLHKFNMDFV